MNNNKKYFIYKNDLKFNQNFDMECSEFETNDIKSFYYNFKEKPKIELRLEDSKMENYRYLDLSKLEIDDIYLSQLIKLDKINFILEKIEFLDLSNNNLKKFTNLSNYSNIIYLNISNNLIDECIIDDNLIELTCHDNLIKSIKSNKIIRLNASNNLINCIDVPNIKILIINYNKIDWIPSLIHLVYLECMNNILTKIDTMLEMEELYIGHNNLLDIYNMPKLKILNCVNNPIKKIKYLPNLKTLMSSTPTVSSQYILENIKKIKSDYLIDFKI